MFFDYFILYIIIIFFFAKNYNFLTLNYFLLVLFLLFNYNIYNINNILVFSFLWVVLLFFININIKLLNNLYFIILCILVLLISIQIMMYSNNLYYFIIGFEFMLLSSLFLLKLTIKTDRGLEALIEMYTWGVFGSFFLLNSIVINYKNLNNFYYILNINSIRDFFFFIGFSIKIPLWPFTSWLLKAHVEASTEFSIFLSGFLVKFGIFGLIKFFYIINSYSIYIFIEFFAIIGLIEATLKLLAQVDLKKIIALTTIIETNWLALFFITNSNIMINLGFLLIFFHCLTTTLEFYFVEIIYKRFNTRSILNISGISFNYPLISKFFTAMVFIIIGLPGTSIFFLKFIFLSFYFTYNFFIFFIISFLFLILIPIFFIKLFLTLNNNITLVCTKSVYSRIGDLSKKEFIILVLPLLLNYFFGFFLYFLF